MKREIQLFIGTTVLAMLALGGAIGVGRLSFFTPAYTWLSLTLYGCTYLLLGVSVVLTYRQGIFKLSAVWLYFLSPFLLGGLLLIVGGFHL